jgi:hypothetical protein
VKPSEVGNGARELPQRKLSFPVDEKAEPPISIEEALAAGSALCIRHGGLIGQRGEKEGMVFLCTDCRMYWRYAKRPSEFLRPLSYPKA